MLTHVQRVNWIILFVVGVTLLFGERTKSTVLCAKQKQMGDTHFARNVKMNGTDLKLLVILLQFHLLVLSLIQRPMLLLLKKKWFFHHVPLKRVDTSVT